MQHTMAKTQAPATSFCKGHIQFYDICILYFKVHSLKVDFVSWSKFSSFWIVFDEDCEFSEEIIYNFMTEVTKGQSLMIPFASWSKSSNFTIIFLDDKTKVLDQ